LKIDDIYTPLWVTGTLKVEKVSNDLADAAYALDGEGEGGGGADL
jgi:hypothetical protein